MFLKQEGLVPLSYNFRAVHISLLKQLIDRELAHVVQEIEMYSPAPLRLKEGHFM